MERSRDYEDLAAVLATVRPEPQPAFAAELDERVAAGFPRRSRPALSPLVALAARLRGLSPQRLLFATGGTALAAIAIATVVVANVDSGAGPAVVAQQAAKQPRKIQFSEEAPRATGRSSESAAAGESLAGHSPAARGDASSAQSSEALPHSGASEIQRTLPSELPESNATYAPLSRSLHREIERSAEIGLIAEPADVADDSTQVFRAVHDAGGIVLHSTTTRGRNAGAHFDLLIPSAKLSDALAAFSAIDEVRTRHEATTDITAPTVALGERLQDSQAKIDGLLSQLSAAETESEREAIEAELHSERRHAAGLRAQLTQLHRRADFSRVSLRIETGAAAADPSGSWGIDDALGDAGHILGIAAGVTVIGLAILAPLALIALLTWLAYRLWLRTRRERALDA